MKSSTGPLLAGLAVIAVVVVVVVLLAVGRSGRRTGADGPPGGLRPVGEPVSNPGSGLPPVGEGRPGEGSDRPGAPADAAAAAAVARFKDTGVPLDERRREIEELARKGDSASIDVLMALGDEKTYLNWAGIAALGAVKSVEHKHRITTYLKGKLADPDSRVLCEAVRAYGRQLGEEAIPALAEIVRANRRREDGHEDMVCNAVAEVLGDLASPRALPILDEEIRRSEEKGWDLEYGSLLVSALSRIGTPEARAAIAAYADRLSKRIPQDPMARSHWEKKIAEAREAARG